MDIIKNVRQNRGSFLKSIKITFWDLFWPKIRNTGKIGQAALALALGPHYDSNNLTNRYF